MERRMRKGFPRFKIIRTHEKADAEEKKRIQKQNENNVNDNLLK
jgi:hypothetical protein